MRQRRARRARRAGIALPALRTRNTRNTDTGRAALAGWTRHADTRRALRAALADTGHALWTGHAGTGRTRRAAQADTRRTLRALRAWLALLTWRARWTRLALAVRVDRQRGEHDAGGEEDDREHQQQRPRTALVAQPLVVKLAR